MSAEQAPTSESTATTDKAPAPDRPTGEDTSLRNFVAGLLAVSAVIVVVAYLIQSSAG